MNEATRVASKAMPQVAADMSAAQRRAIVLLSDGTGNHSGKLFKTNVWRMYEAVDLGPASDGQGPVQIAFYDNGVGTSSVKLLAMVGGIFGWGLKRNILDIYRFLCRNWDHDSPGRNDIYAFGFSRGAYTIRLVVALIGDQGIVPFEDERHLRRQTLDAYRAFQAKNRPNVFPWAASAVRAGRDGLIALKRALLRQPSYEPGKPGVPVRFVGVWDTVAAYGGPIAEITRGIDDWIWPLTMTDQRLGDHVEHARHALALDDERDSFQPVLWDEVHERMNAEVATMLAKRERRKGQPDPARLAGYELREQKYATRLQQVWFAGMHSDVGGGYPDESLSYVSLLWIMREAGAAGLRLLPDAVRRVQIMATPFGPLHDSRQNLAGYFRYQPRKIPAYFDPRGVDPAPELRRRKNRKAHRLVTSTLNLRDPRTGEYRNRPQGLLLNCLVHDSVVARINSGTDGYAPIALPPRFTVTPPPPPPALKGARDRPDLVDPDGLLNLDKSSEARGEWQENSWDFVFGRRLAYFFMVFASLFILITPWLASAESRFDGRSVWDVIVGWTGAVLPDLLDPWLRVLAADPAWILMPAALIGIVKWLSGWMESSLRDRMRRIWRLSLQGQLGAAPTSSPLRRFRNSTAYQRSVQFLKWRIMPVLFGWGLILLALVGLLAIATQVQLSRRERHPALCQPGPVAIAGPVPTTFSFDTAEPCNRTGIGLRKGQRYRVTFVLPSGAEWKDGGTDAHPGGIGTWHFPLGNQVLMWPATLLRRVVLAGWMEPLYAIRQYSLVDGKLVDIYVDRLAPAQVDGRWVAEFEAPIDGHLFMFVNDATLPWSPLSFFYSDCRICRNTGVAQVSVEALGRPEQADRPPLARAPVADRTRPRL